jgi:hypothetical protein
MREHLEARIAECDGLEGELLGRLNEVVGMRRAFCEVLAMLDTDGSAPEGAVPPVEPDWHDGTDPG